MVEEEKNGLVINRIFDAPIELVWEAWTNSEIVKKWWGPKDFTCPVAEIDFRIGGKYLSAMHGPKGTEFDRDFWSTGEYKEIIPMEKIVVEDSFSDDKGNVVPSTYYGMEGFPEKQEIIITFEEENGKTKMTLRYPSVGDIDEKTFNDMKQGWNQSFDKLENVLKPFK